MLESVYGQDAFDDLPDALAQVEMKADGDDSGAISLAGFNALDLEMGYSQVDFRWDDTNAPTRLGQPTIMVRLARQVEGVWKPFCEAKSNSWEMSQLSIRRAFLEEETVGNKQVADELRETMLDKGKYCVIVPLTEKNGRWLGEALDGNKKKVAVEYDSKLGFRISKDGDE
jgi:CRISPR-associated endonuclease/helicase Cas3